MATSGSKEEPGEGLKFECGICLKEFSTAWLLQVHIKTHDEKQPFDCRECGMMFPNFAELWEHMKQHVVGEGSVPAEENLKVCSVCGKKYPVSRIAMHQRSHIFKPGLTCTTCGKSFGSSQVLKLHLRTHGKKTFYHCQICGLKFASRNSFTFHWSSHGTSESPDSHRMKYKSKDKSEISKVRSQPMNMFSRRKKSDNCYKCNICSKTFITSTKLEVHSLCHQSQTDKKSQKNSAATEHETGHEIIDKNQAAKSILNEKPPFFGFVKALGKNFFCSVCKKEYKAKAKAERHAKYHYYEERQKIRAEGFTEYSEARRSRGKQHLSAGPGEVGPKHTTRKQQTGNGDNDRELSSTEDILTCSECNKTFSEIDDLQQHKQLHIKECTLALMRMLSPTKDMNLTLESETFLDAVKSAAKLTDKGNKKQRRGKTKDKTKSYPKEAVPEVAPEDCDLVTDDENDALEVEHFNEEHKNESFVSLPDIFVSPNNSQEQRANRKGSMVSSEDFIPNKDPCSVEVHQHMMNDNKITCKVCSKEFSSIEQISVHIKSHLKKDDSSGTVFQLSDFHDLQKMINVKVVLERLDMHKLGISSRKGGCHLGRVHTKDIPTTSKDKTSDPLLQAHSASIESDHRLASEDISLASKYPTFVIRSANDHKTENSSLVHFDDSGDDLDGFERYSSGTDSQDEDWVPSNKSRVGQGSLKSRSEPIKAKFVSSDGETSRVDGNDQINAVAAAIVACDVDQDDHEKDLSTCVQDIDRMSTNKREELEGFSDFTHVVDLNASDSEPPYTSYKDINANPETHQISLSNTAVAVSSTVNDLVADDTEAMKEVMLHCTKVGDVYICRMCSREYDSEFKIHNHIGNHLRVKPYKCKFCGHSFDRKAMLGLHLQSHEKQHAQVGGVTDQDVKNIQESFYERDGVFRCKTCVYYYRFRSDAYRHALTHLFPRSKENSCSSDPSRGDKSETTSKTFTLEYIMKHIVEEDGWFRCVKCMKKLKDRNGAQAHVKRHFFGPSFKCNQCPYAAYTKHHLQRHYRTHEGIVLEEEEYIEPNVEYHETTADKLTDHMTERKLERFTMEDAMKYLFEEGGRFRCLECDTIVNTKKAAHVHVKRHFRDPMFRCTMCLHAAYTQHHLDRHIKSHKRQKKWNEDLPEQPTESFTSKDAEKYIIKEKEKFQCSICHSLISNESNAKMHVVRHLKSAKFKCPHCEYRNHSRHYIRRHMKTHGKKTKKYPIKVISPEGNHSEVSESTCGASEVNEGKEEASDDSAETSGTCKGGGDLDHEEMDGANEVEVSQGPGSLGPMTSGNISNREFVKEVNENISKLGSNFQCEICLKKYATRKKLYDHVVNHLRKKHLKCEYCGHEFYNMNFLIKHEMCHLRQLVEFNDLADEDIPSIKDKFVVQDGLSYCLICNSNFKTRIGAYRHVVDHLIFEKNRASEPVFSVPCLDTEIVDEAQRHNKNGNNDPLSSAEKIKISPDVSANRLDVKEAYKDAVMSNSIEDIQVVDNSTHVVTEQEIPKRMNSNPLPEEGIVRNTSSDSEAWPSADSERLKGDTVRDKSKYKFRVPLSAPISGKDFMDLSSDEELDVDENLNEDERHIDYKCYSETDKSEQESVSVKKDVAESSCITTELGADDQNHGDVRKAENLQRSTDSRIGLKADEKRNVHNEELAIADTKKISHLNGNIIKVGDKYRCKICKKEFALKVKCYSHVTYHFKKKKFICEDCGYSAVSRSYLLVHMGKHKKKMVEFPCKICQHVFSKSKFLTKHIALHSDEDKMKYLNYLECETCGIVCRTIKVLYRHKLQHLESFQCKCCDVILPSAVALENHAYEMKHFHCEKCGKNYSEMKTLYNHQKGVHDNAGNYQCDHCAKTFVTRSNFKQHVQIHEVKYECKGCRARFQTLKELKEHKHIPRSDVRQVVNEMSEYTYQCELCSKTFKTTSRLESHKLIHQALAAIGEDIQDGSPLTNVAPSQNLTCPVCPKKYPSVLKLMEHVRIHTDVQKYKNKHVPVLDVETVSEYQCDLCYRTFKSSSRLQCHKIIHQALAEIGEDVQDGNALNNIKLSQIITCPVCKKEYPSVFKLNDHVRVHTDVKKYECDVCGAAFANRANFMTHQNIHKNIRPFQCDQCPRAFPSQNYLRNHKKQSHRKEKRVMKIVPCDICGKRLSAKSIRSHKILHDEEKHVKKFSCDLCEKKFYTPDQVKNHKKNVHTKDSVHMCDICGKFLNSKYILKEHEKIHTGERPFQCSECGNTFKTKEALKRHFLVHSGEKAYKCEFCDKAFGLPETLRNHRYIHTGEKPYKCDLCGQRFSDRWARHNHVKKHKLG